jgi:hypothetical protein
MPVAKKSRATRFPRQENEFPSGIDAVEEASKLRLGIDYIVLGSGGYAFTEKVFSTLVASKDQGVGEQSEVTAGAASLPDDKAAPAALHVPGDAVAPFPPIQGVSVEVREEQKLSQWGVPPTSRQESEKSMIVSRLVPNTRILLAVSAPNDGKIYHVWVGNSDLYAVGMPFNAVPHPQESAFWKAVGIPTSKGRW